MSAETEFEFRFFLSSLIQLNTIDQKPDMPCTGDVICKRQKSQKRELLNYVEYLKLEISTKVDKLLSSERGRKESVK